MVQVSRSPVRRERVVSADGTEIAVTVTGDGPPLVVCHGSMATARDWHLVARRLASEMTVYGPDRRGHDRSGDRPAYSLAREQEDLATVADLAGGEVTLLGHSYGALIALSLARYEPPVRLVLYEPPLAMNNLVGGAAVDEYERAAQAGDADRALALGLREFVGMPAAAVDLMRGQPIWTRLTSMVPSWPREIRALDDYLTNLGGDLGQFSTLDVPVLLLTGELSPPWLIEATHRLAAVLPDATVTTLPGQAHDAHIFAPSAVAGQIARFALNTADS
jgi:pimeloyl-ACP methyl ester carboxylesterase